MNPLRSYETLFLRSGGCLIRHTTRHPIIMMWTTTNPTQPAETHQNPAKPQERERNGHQATRRAAAPGGPR